MKVECEYYRRFIKGYAKIATPLSQLLCKGQFQWSEMATEAFNALKKAISTAPVLALPNFEIPFVVEMDSSGTRIGAVLSQTCSCRSMFPAPTLLRVMTS